jgi:hypothetical protein
MVKTSKKKKKLVKTHKPVRKSKGYNSLVPSKKIKKSYGKFAMTMRLKYD